MSDKRTFKTDPRSYALALIEEGLVSADLLLIALLKYMSHDEVRDCMEANALDPDNIDSGMEDDDESDDDDENEDDDESED